MAIVYPGGIDSFGVPNSPENTSLSEAGTDGRSHTQSHADLGAAIVALENNTAFRNHTHGGGSGLGSSPKLVQANTHESADTDSALTALHHTLGTGPFQAAPGNHVHDYASLLNRPLVVCTSTTRPGQPFFGMQIWETDTNRARVWSAFPDNTANLGKYGRDDFTRTSSVNLGADLWEQTYTAGAGKGIMATPSGTEASWIDQSNDYNRCTARRINPIDRETLTDDQMVIFRVGETPIEDYLPLTGDAANDVYLRMSADRQSYWRAQFEHDNVKLYYTTGGMAEEIRIGQINVDVSRRNTDWHVTVVGYRISVYRNGVFIGAAVDSDEESNKGAGYRGWGIGMIANARGFGQTTPASIQYVSIQDNIFYTATNKWALLSTGSIPVLRALQGSRQTIPAGANGAVIEWRSVIEDTFGMMNTNASRTEITIRESGLYDISVSLAWDANLLNEMAYVGLEINGLNTLYYRWEKAYGGLSGGDLTNVDYSTKIRFTEGDVLRVRARHNKGFNIFTKSASADKIDSHIELTFLSP